MSTNHGNTSRRRVSAVHGLARFCTLGGWPTPFIRAVFFCGWIGFGLAAFAQDQATFIRSELKGLVRKGSSPAPPDDPLNQVKVFVELDTAQSEVQRGILFLLDIANEGSESMEILDPSKKLHVYLYNALDLRVDIPPPPFFPRGHLRDPEGFDARWEGRRPFRVTEVQRDQQESSVKSTPDVKEGKVRLEPGEHFQVNVQVTKIIADAERYWTEKGRRQQQPADSKPATWNPPEIIPVGVGSYRLSVSVFLRSADPVQTPSNSFCISGSIPVRLGSNPNPSD